MALAGLVAGVREVVPGRLYVLGGAYELDGRVTWAPSDEVGFQATNCFLLREGSRVTVIDPGPAYHADSLMAQLETLMPIGSELDVFLTRAEFDCFGCLGAISARYRVGKLMTGGAHNPFDAFDDVSQETPMERLAVGSEVNIGGSRKLSIIRPAIRLLATFWAYDSGTRSLFTSDVFTHLLGATADEAVNCDTNASATLSQIHRHLLAKHWWLASANTQPLLAALAETFTSRQIDYICPDRGRVICGRAAVDRTYAAMREVLLEMDDAS
jgi:flavorubredoxin